MGRQNPPKEGRAHFRRQTPPPPPKKADLHQDTDTAVGYGQQAGSTHHTENHTCLSDIFQVKLKRQKVEFCTNEMMWWNNYGSIGQLKYTGHSSSNCSVFYLCKATCAGLCCMRKHKRGAAFVRQCTCLQRCHDIISPSNEPACDVYFPPSFFSGFLEMECYVTLETHWINLI